MSNYVHYIKIDYKEEKPEGIYCGDKISMYRYKEQMEEEFEEMKNVYRNSKDFKDFESWFSGSYEVRTGKNTSYKVSFSVMMGSTPSGQEHYFGPYLIKEQKNG